MSFNEEEAYKITFGRVLALSRESCGLTQMQFCEATGLKQPTLSRIERGLILPDVYGVKAIAAALGRTPAELGALTDDALERTLQAAKRVLASSSKATTWDAIAKQVGIEALKGLIDFAVGACLVAAKT